MYKITLWPGPKIVEIPGHRPLLFELRDVGVLPKSRCGGVANCGECIFQVVGDDKNLNQINFDEKKLLGNVYFITKERLSCQAKINGDCELDFTASWSGEKK